MVSYDLLSYIWSRLIRMELIVDGESFEVHDPKLLERDVLPHYFRHARFQSLVRQLNFYSFKVTYLKYSISFARVSLLWWISTESWSREVVVGLFARQFQEKQTRPLAIVEKKDEWWW